MWARQGSDIIQVVPAIGADFYDATVKDVVPVNSKPKRWVKVKLNDRFLPGEARNERLIHVTPGSGQPAMVNGCDLAASPAGGSGACGAPAEGWLPRRQRQTDSGAHHSYRAP